MLQTPPITDERLTDERPLLGRSLASLTEWVVARGQSAYRGKQLHQWIYQRGVRSLDEVTVFSKKWRAEVSDFPVGRSQLHYRSESPDGTVKYLLRLKDGLILEAVGIPS
ncbi:MAG: 23S rRNA (adenine(2503)-C(2))-methyltransferase RlmN, partial [Cyanobacteria bacterium J06554_11]